MIKDSGTRREFESGAVRDVAEGKGRCDLLALLEVADLLPYYGYDKGVIENIAGNPQIAYAAEFNCGTAG